MTVRKLRQKRGWAFSIGVSIVKPALLATTVPDWEGGENLPDLEAEIQASRPRMQAALAGLAERTVFVKVLGCYPARELPR